MCVKFKVPEDREVDLKVYDQTDTEVDADVFEELVKESPGAFRVMLKNEELGNNHCTNVFILNWDGNII